MEVFTIQISNWREAARLKIEIVNTTVKVRHPLFAPTWDMVLGHKEGRVSDEEYTQLYYDRMRHSWQQHQADWAAFLQRPEPVALGCYCSPGAFCHRHLLNRILSTTAAHLNLPYVYYGELE